VVGGGDLTARPCAAQANGKLLTGNTGSLCEQQPAATATKSTSLSLILILAPCGPIPQSPIPNKNIIYYIVAYCNPGRGARGGGGAAAACGCRAAAAGLSPRGPAGRGAALGAGRSGLLRSSLLAALLPLSTPRHTARTRTTPASRNSSNSPVSPYLYFSTTPCALYSRWPAPCLHSRPRPQQAPGPRGLASYQLPAALLIHEIRPTWRNAPHNLKGTASIANCSG
jgi:hypothetical protein